MANCNWLKFGMVMIMKKVALAALLATGLMAAGNEDYFGVSVGEAKSSVTASDGTSSATVDDTEGAYNLALGHYYENSRIALTYTHLDLDNVDTSEALTLSYDFFYTVGRGLNVFAGPGIGYAWIKDDAVDLSGFMYGGEAGAQLRINSGLELEAGYRYMRATGSDNDSGTKVELDDLATWYIGANIRF
jgi:opacity protein-like surface antigen